MKVGDDASPAKNSLEISYLFILTVLRTCVASKPFVEAGSVEWRTRVEDKDEDGHQNKKLPRDKHKRFGLFFWSISADEAGLTDGKDGESSI